MLGVVIVFIGATITMMMTGLPTATATTIVDYESLYNLYYFIL